MNPSQRRVEREMIMRIPWRSLRVPLLAMPLVGVGALWAGYTDNMGIFSWMGSVGRVIVIGLAYFILVAVLLLVISNLIQDWAVLVGTASGLQVIYPLGLHRFMPKSRLVGDLIGAELLVSRAEPRSVLQPALLAFEVRAPEGTLHFRVSNGGINIDYERRFAHWLAKRGTPQIGE